MNIAYLGLGSNLGDRETYLSQALSLIEEQAGRISLVSGIYETAAWGVDGQPDYLNLVVQIKTNLYPLELLKHILAIEKVLGRERIQKWGSRTIDIDFLFYENYHFETKELTIPHPWISERKFVLAPLNDIAPDFIHPLKNKTVYELLQQCRDQSEVRKI